MESTGNNPPATVVNGRVYAACDNQVVVFGLVPVPPQLTANVKLISRVGTRRTIQVTVTDRKTGNPVGGATVTVLDDTGRRKAIGSTNAQGTVDLTYIECTEVITKNGGKPIVVPFPCDGIVEKSGYQSTGFSTPA